MNEAYSQIYPYYDTLMSFIDYPAWIKYVEKLLFRDGIREKKIFDLACGSGECLKIWQDKGYEIMGLDNSPGMLEMARKKLNDNVELILADMRDFSLAEKVPIITCLYDSLNYLLTEEELLACFRAVFNALKEKGIFIFDMNTLYCLKHQWGNQTVTRENGHVYSIWKNTYDEKKDISTLFITLFIDKGDNYFKTEEIHQERGYPIETVRTLLEQAGFSKIEVFPHMTFLPLLDTTLRIMIKARR